MYVGRATKIGGPSVISSFTPYLKAMRPEDILLPTPAGVYCKIGGFPIDPPRPVDKAMITHGHSARRPWRRTRPAGDAPPGAPAVPPGHRRGTSPAWPGAVRASPCHSGASL